MSHNLGHLSHRNLYSLGYSFRLAGFANQHVAHKRLKLKRERWQCTKRTPYENKHQQWKAVFFRARTGLCKGRVTSWAVRSGGSGWTCPCMLGIKLKSCSQSWLHSPCSLPSCPSEKPRGWSNPGKYRNLPEHCTWLTCVPRPRAYTPWVFCVYCSKRNRLL